jgi:hypothetical protein
MSYALHTEYHISVKSCNLGVVSQAFETYRAGSATEGIRSQHDDGFS